MNRLLYILIMSLFSAYTVAEIQCPEEMDFTVNNVEELGITYEHAGTTARRSAPIKAQFHIGNDGKKYLQCHSKFVFPEPTIADISHPVLAYSSTYEIEGNKVVEYVRIFRLSPRIRVATLAECKALHYSIDADGDGNFYWDQTNGAEMVRPIVKEFDNGNKLEITCEYNGSVFSDRDYDVNTINLDGNGFLRDSEITEGFCRSSCSQQQSFNIIDGRTQGLADALESQYNSCFDICSEKIP